MESLLSKLNSMKDYESYNKVTTITETIDRCEDGSYKTSSSTRVDECLKPITKPVSKSYNVNDSGRVTISKREPTTVTKKAVKAKQLSISNINLSMCDPGKISIPKAIKVVEHEHIEIEEPVENIDNVIQLKCKGA